MLSPNRLWSVLFLSLFLLLAGCNSHKSGSSATAPEALPGTETVYGVAATGAAVRGTVTLKNIGDPAAAELSTHTDTGDFNFNVTGQKGPFLLRAVSDDGQTTLLSFVHKGTTNTRANINPLSNLITLYAGIGLDARLQDPAYLYANAQLLAPLSQSAVTSARQAVMSQRSTKFKELLAQQGLDVQAIDPLRDAFEIGKGLDRVLDGVAFSYDPQTSETTEFDTATRAPINGGILTLLREELVAVHIADAPELMAQETSTRLRLIGTWKDGSIKPLANGVVWRVSDTALADMSTSGMLTTHRLPDASSRTIWATASYVVNGKSYSDEVGVEVSPGAVLKQVRMHIDGLPTTMKSRPDGVIELDANGTFFVQGKLLWHDGTSSFADWKNLSIQDGELAVEGVYSLGGWPWPWQTNSRALTTFKPGVDTELTLRGEVVVNGEVYLLSQRVVLKPFVRKVVGLELSCDAGGILPGDAVSCATSLRFNDDSRETVEAALSLPGVDEVDAQVVGNKVQSNWAATASSKDIQVKAAYGDFSATTPLRLLAKGNRVLSLDITGVSELNEGSAANLQAWANWSDGTRTDVTSQVNWSLKPTSYAVTFYGGQLKAGYILDGTSDQVLTVAVTMCPQPYHVYCGSMKSVSAGADITLKYRNPMLVDVRITTPIFVAENSTLTLTGEAVWNKKKSDGSSFTSALDVAAQWSAEGATASVQGSSLTVSSEPSEPLIWLGVSYTDPYDAQVARSAQAVLTIRKALPNSTVVLDAGSLIDTEGVLYSLETTGWSTPDELRKTIRQRYLSAIRQEVSAGYYSGGRYFLREGGSVWREQAVNSLTDAELSSKLRGIISLDANLPDEVPRRLSAAPATTALVYLGSYYSPYGHNSMYGLGTDGRVWYLNTYNPTSVIYESAVSDVAKLIGNGQSIVALTKSGTVWVAGNNDCGALAQGHFNSSYPRSNFVQVKTSSGVLTDIVDVAVSSNAILALDNQGYLWTWGCNGSGDLGQGDKMKRAYATRIEAVSGFIAPLSNVSARYDYYYGTPPSFLALRKVGDETSVWGWGGNVLAPQMAAGSEGAVAPSGAGGYVVKADGGLHRVLPPSAGAVQWGLQALWTRSADGKRVPLTVSR